MVHSDLSYFTDDYGYKLLRTQNCIEIYMKQSNRSSRFVVSFLMSFHLVLPRSGSFVVIGLTSVSSILVK